MTRRSAQILVLLLVLVLLVLVVWYQYRQQEALKTQILLPPPPPGYGYYPQDLSPFPPVATLDASGLPLLDYLVPFGDFITLDALQMAQEVPDLNTTVRWVADDSNYEDVVIGDSDATRTYFYAPNTLGELFFELQVVNTTTLLYEPVAIYRFTVAPEPFLSVDLNADGRYGLVELAGFLSNWNSYGSNSINLLGYMLSRYFSLSN
ncbi:MAG: hypothetical protein Q8O95_00185 [bacterium]|nr:hypothetical protein [bacterium]